MNLFNEAARKLTESLVKGEASYIASYLTYPEMIVDLYHKGQKSDHGTSTGMSESLLKALFRRSLISMRYSMS